MSRSGYTDDCEGIAMWRGQVASAIRGKRGQKLLKELLAALDAMPEKRLEREVFDDGAIPAGDAVVDGGVCALGALCRQKGLDVTGLDPEDSEAAEWLAGKLDVAHQLTREIIYMNDEAGRHRFDPKTNEWVRETPEERWQRMRDWVAAQIKDEAP